MKAILRNNRKVIVDVIPLDGIPWEDSCLYQDKETKRIYAKWQLDWVEYYGG